MKYKITKEQNSMRLDKFLVEKTKKPRNQIQNQIKKGLVEIDGNIVKANHKLREDETIVVKKEKIKKVEKEIKKLPEIKIIKETKEFIVINKPAGLIVHGGDQVKEKTLVDIVLKQWPEIRKVGEDPARPGIVHRLDKEVSGLMVIARTEKSFENLKKQFQERSIIKNYIALVYKQILKDSDEINFKIKRSNQGFKMAAIPTTVKGKKSTEGRYAITHFDVIKKFINYTLLSVKIITGRTHQIRVHLSAYGHPVVGDGLYTKREQKNKNEKLQLGRIFLFANNLEFKNLDGEKVSFKIEMPEKLKELLDKVK